jgi:hypothetical protein
MSEHTVFIKEETGRLNAAEFLLCARLAAEHSMRDVEVLYRNDRAYYDKSARELFTNAVGGIFVLESPSLGSSYGGSTQMAVPALLLKPQDVSLHQPDLAMELTTVLTFSDRRGDQEWAELTQGIQQWFEGLPRYVSDQRPTTLSIEELRQTEVFMTEFYRWLHREAIGLPSEELVTAQIHVDTINLQLRAPKPDRSVVKASFHALRSVLGGVGIGVAASNLYQLLPHIH